MLPPSVSVVIPTHGRRALLADAVESVLAERSVPLELIVVDDASPDDTWQWLAGLEDERVRPLRAPGGRAAVARNIGLGAVRAQLVLPLDDDDLLVPGALAAMVAELMAARAEVVGVGGRFVTFGDGVDVPHRQPHPARRCTTTIWREEIFGWNLPPGTTLWRSRHLEALGGWDESLARCEDLELNLRAGRSPLVLVPRTTLRYRVHDGQVSGELRRRDEELDAGIRADFVSSLPSPASAEAAAILRARSRFLEGLSAYLRGEHRAAATRFAGALRQAPRLVRSPVLGPYLLGMVAKAAAAGVAPERAVGAARAARVRRRLTSGSDLA